MNHICCVKYRLWTFRRYLTYFWVVRILFWKVLSFLCVPVCFKIVFESVFVAVRINNVRRERKPSTQLYCSVQHLDFLFAFIVLIVLVQHTLCQKQKLRWIIITYKFMRKKNIALLFCSCVVVYSKWQWIS